VIETPFFWGFDPAAKPPIENYQLEITNSKGVS
jgi:hypothetical protein